MDDKANRKPKTNLAKSQRKQMIRWELTKKDRTFLRSFNISPA